MTEPGGSTTAPSACACNTATGIVWLPTSMIEYVRSGPSLTAQAVTSVRGGTRIQILCTIYGDSVHNRQGQVSALWDKIQTGYVPDVDVNTGTTQPTMPACT
jgi:hypothetical protein